MTRLPEFLTENDVDLAYVFGSLADGREPHDVDLALLRVQDGVSELRGALAAHFGTERLDLVDLARAGPTLRFHVLKTGRLIYARDRQTENEWELKVTRMYQDRAPKRDRQRKYLKQRMARWSSTAPSSSEDSKSST